MYVTLLSSLMEWHAALLSYSREKYIILGFLIVYFFIFLWHYIPYLIVFMSLYYFIYLMQEKTHCPTGLRRWDVTMKPYRKGDLSCASNAIPFPFWWKMVLNCSQFRLAVVTGGNRGIGLEVCRQLAVQGVTVILTARNEKRGKDAVQYLRHECNLSNVIYHPLDILDGDSVALLSKHIESRYGKLDILVKWSLSASNPQ